MIAITLHETQHSYRTSLTLHLLLMNERSTIRFSRRKVRKLKPCLHSLVEHLVFQYFSISSAVLPGILPAIRDHLIIKIITTWVLDILNLKANKVIENRKNKRETDKPLSN
jgi:hypothetical protein